MLKIVSNIIFDFQKEILKKNQKKFIKKFKFEKVKFENIKKNIVFYLFK